MSILDQMSNHLQFLGYDIADSDEAKKASHVQRWNIVFREYKGGVLFSASLSGSAYAKSEENRQAFLELINSMNRAASVARFYSDEDQDFVMEAMWSGDYERVSFGRFMDLWDSDTRSLLRQLDSEKFFE